MAKKRAVQNQNNSPVIIVNKFGKGLNLTPYRNGSLEKNKLHKSFGGR